ncbi:MAG: hypothetical protein PWP48_1869 [Clostridiales bacterium]|nr:hypothetical protein [Clostridiales bacterium]
MTELENNILEILSDDHRVTAEQISAMLDVDVKEVEATIKALEDRGVIVKYNTIINWEKTDREFVAALIEVKVVPQRDQGFDVIAERIYRFPEVQSVYLMSGDYDLAVTVEGKTMKDIAYFVAERLSPLESVLSTATHFILKKYKVEGIILDDHEQDHRLAVSP